MKINLDWLSEYVDLPNPAEELVDVLPMLGIEVEENDDSGTKSLENVVVGEVLEKSQHPEADRLSVCSVEVGAENPAQIVCGATNFKPGDRVPVALPGAKLPGGFKIKKSKLRGLSIESRFTTFSGAPPSNNFFTGTSSFLPESVRSTSTISIIVCGKNRGDICVLTTS